MGMGCCLHKYTSGCGTLLVDVSIPPDFYCASFTAFAGGQHTTSESSTKRPYRDNLPEWIVFFHLGYSAMTVVLV